MLERINLWLLHSDNPSFDDHHTSCHYCYRETSIHQPSKALIPNPAATSLCIAFVACWISTVQGRYRWQSCHLLFYAHVVGAKISLFVSLYALTANLSVDRLLALLLGRRNREIVTLSRVYVVLISRSLGLSKFWQYHNFLI